MKDQQSREEIMNVFRDALYAFGDMKALASRTGLSVTCLSNIRSGRTKWPRWITLEILMLILNIRMTVKQF